MAKTQSMRLTRTESGQEWWNMTLWLFSSNTWTEKDRKESESLQNALVNEKMPSTFSGFVNHPLYALERHCKKNEIIYPKENIVGYIKGEAVYLRSQVQSVWNSNDFMI
jgi:xeroderma pigmentosum group C-complementing protein